MSASAEDLEGLRGEIGRHEWSKLRSFAGDSSRLPLAIEALVFADSDEDARAAYWRIDNVALVQGRLSESVLPVTACLLVGLPFSKGGGRANIFDLLATIAGGYGEHVDTKIVGAVSSRECVQLMARSLPTFIGEVRRGNPSCVDILLMCAVYEPLLRDRVNEVFQEALRNPACAHMADLVESSIVDLHSEG